MNRRVLRIGAIVGAVTVSALAIAPVFAAGATSQSSAQSLNLSLAGNALVTQTKTASNNGSAETLNDASTLPALAGLIPGNNAISAGVAVQNAKANTDGTSYACAGLAGTGGGLATVGNSDCNINGGPLTLDLGSLDLDIVNLLGGNGAITSALNSALAPILQPVLGLLDDVVGQVLTGLAATPLGEIGISGGLSVIEATCTANPDAAQGSARLVGTNGGGNIPITLNLPTVGPVVLVNLNVDVAPKPGGTDLLVNLDTVTAALFQSITTQVETMLGGALGPLAQLLDTLLPAVQDQIVETLVDALEPVLTALSDNLLKVTINDVTPGDNGRSVTATALQLSVLPAIKDIVGGGLVDGTVGKVTCGPNTRGAAEPPTDEPTDDPTPEVPTVVDSGVSGQSNSTARNVLLATGALLAMAGTAGLIGYRRMLVK